MSDLKQSGLQLRRALVGLAALLTAVVAPHRCWGCACGCGVFDVQTNALMPNGSGGTAYLEYDYQDQNQNWSGTSSAPAANNSDKEIRTNFFKVGAEYMLNRKWGVMGDVPYWGRYFNTTDANGNIAGYNHSSLGDIRVNGVYSGFSPDMSTGITFGVKLPTGDCSYPNFDRDTEIGSGSTDILFGVYHTASLTKGNLWNWFSSAQLDQPVLITGDYRPGGEMDVTTGVYYNGWTIGKYKVAPILQAIGSVRARDAGALADPSDSGYGRVLLAPGLEVHAGGFKVDGDIAFPVVQNVNGNQLVASELCRVIVSHDF